MSDVQLYRSNPLKGLLGVVVFAALGGAAAVIAPAKPVVGWAFVLLFGGFTLAALASLFGGGTTLRLGRKGFELRTLWKTTRVRWDEMEPAEIAQIKKTRCIAVNYLPGMGKLGMSRALTGIDVNIPNTFKAPLEEVCGALNARRSRYLDAHPAVRASSRPLALDASAFGTGDAPAPAGRPPRPVLMAVVSALLVLVLNVVLRLVLKLHGGGLTVGIAFGVAILVTMWFVKTVNRHPTPQERSRFVWTYAALVVLPSFAWLALASLSREFNVFAFLILAMHTIPYPAAAEFCLREKRFMAVRPGRAAQ